MRRLLWLLAGFGLLAAGLWLAGRPPSRYVLERECARYHEARRERFTLLAFHISKADPDARPDLDERMEELLAETKRIDIRGWEVVLVPPGARAPRDGFTVAARVDPSVREDPPALKGPMQAWTRPVGWLAQLFSRR